jgi:lycopene beta-cyclase
MYDIVFSGFGTSTCLLLIEMENKSLLDGKKSLIIDPSTKLENDKTFCFWATETDPIVQELKHIISHSWNKIQIDSAPASTISPLNYYHIKSIDLFNEAKAILQKHQIRHLTASVKTIYKEESFKVETNDNQAFESNWIFDSRPPDLSSVQKSTSFLYQSFIGFKVKLHSSEFESSTYRMMDFEIPQGDSTQFMYVLPYSKSTGLVEMTRFGKERITEEKATAELNIYIASNFGDFEVLEIERGVIPMSPMIPQMGLVDKWVMIGTRAGNVKPSTGFAFKNMFLQAKEICDNQKLNHPHIKQKRRFVLYDQLLLIILSLWPDLGKPIFQRLFTIQKPGFILKFLDEKTTVWEEAHLFSRLQIFTFLKAFVYWFFIELKRFKSLSILLLISMLYILLDKTSALSTENLAYGLLIIGLFAVGIPHGALDNLVSGLKNKNQNVWVFSLAYIGLMIPIFLIWNLLPLAGLVSFLLYSAWHFGQTDMVQWKIHNTFLGLIWGTLFLGFLLLSHLNEFNQVLLYFKIAPIKDSPIWNYLTSFFLLVSMGLAAYHKSREWFFMIVFIALSSFIPLIISFGLYFVFYHSWNGWAHLKKELAFSHRKMYLHSLPFNIGAILIFGLAFLKMDQVFLENVSYFFVFLSCISFPHILLMHRFYKQTQPNKKDYSY